MTATATATLKSALDKANPNQLGDIFSKMKMGTMMTPLKRTFTGLTSAALFDLTTIDAAGETTGVANPNRVAAQSIDTLRVTAGAAAAGHRDVTDVGGTPSATLATISDDGKTVTFEAGVTAFVITYSPRSTVAMTDAQSAFDGAP
jgi:hypothetical protein